MSTAKLAILNPTYLMCILTLYVFVGLNNCVLIEFEDFYSQSFIPNALQIAYRIENNVSINYNVTMLIPFPGKILLNIFVRKLAKEGSGDRSQDMLKYNKMDFCKTLEVLKNFTMGVDTYNGDQAVLSTFIRSCPLNRGFYYIANGTLDDEVVPFFFTSGQYWVQFEVVQVFDEVIRLVNIKAKAVYHSRW